MQRDARTTRQPRQASEGAPRQYVDHEGRVWRVVEREVPLPGRSLFFESDAGWRKVREYPRDWRSLTPEELENLSRQR
jgi:hypothetical protein